MRVCVRFRDSRSEKRFSSVSAVFSGLDVVGRTVCQRASHAKAWPFLRYSDAGAGSETRTEEVVWFFDGYRRGFATSLIRDGNCGKIGVGLFHLPWKTTFLANIAILLRMCACVGTYEQSLVNITEKCCHHASSETFVSTTHFILKEERAALSANLNKQYCNITVVARPRHHHPH